MRKMGQSTLASAKPSSCEPAGQETVLRNITFTYSAVTSTKLASLVDLNAN